MQRFLQSPIRRLRLLGFIEGTSLLIILFITMPLKYGAGLTEPNYVLGMIHGILFIAYLVVVAQVHFLYKWSVLKTGKAVIASVVPFGTFWADKVLFRPEEEEA